MYQQADIGVFGGTGFYALADGVRKIDVDSRYGKPSDSISLVRAGDKTIAFLPRHGSGHTLNPWEINYRANVDAMDQLGVKAIISPCCVGSLREDFRPGDFVVSDQFINFTSGRQDTYFKSPNVESPSSADPYDARLRQVALEAGKELGLTMHDGGTIAVINGPRFSTRAESKMFAALGADTINMTQYPEGYLCLEKGIPVVNIALITDYDAGLEGNPNIAPVTMEQVVAVLAQNNENLKKLVFKMAEKL